MTDRPGPAPITVALVAIALATALVALGLAIGTDSLGRSAVVPEPTTAVPERGADATFDLTTDLPETGEVLAGEWAAGDDGASVTTAAAAGVPLLSVPVDGPPWATATVEGSAVEGWSVAFGMRDAATFWAVTLHPGLGTVELLRFLGGQPSTVATRPLAGDPTATAVVRWQGRQVQVELSGVALPTVTVPVDIEPAVGLLGRGAAAQPGAARWTSVAIEAGTPLGPVPLPPILGSRHVTADEAREGLGG